MGDTASARNPVCPSGNGDCLQRRLSWTITVGVIAEDQAVAPATSSPPSARSCRLPSPRSHRTALRSSRPLGSAEITHPFHPLRGQRFVVLKVRTVSGVETLSLRQAELGSFAVAREWTDWAPPGAQAVPSDGKALLIDASG